MLVLRKEIKIGIGAGLTILGIAAVYGLIAALSSSGVDSKKEVAANVSTEDKKGLDKGVDGLPPPEPDLTAQKPEAPAHDPFAENGGRTDGNRTTDPWATALTSGKIGGDVKAPAVIKAPTDKADGKLVVIPPAGDKGKVVSPLDATHKMPAKTGTGDATASAGNKYVIQAGDTFSTIAKKQYGSKAYSTALIKANPDVNPSRLRVGKEITLPAKEQIASVGGSVGRDAAQLSGPVDTSRHQYRVATGDTLSRISTKLYGTSTKWNDLYETNKTAIGSDPARLKVGTLIDLPQKSVR